MQFRVEQIERLCWSSNLSPEKQANFIRRAIQIIDNNSDNEFDYVELESIVKELYDNQIDPIVNGAPYSQKDIIRHLKKLR